MARKSNENKPVTPLYQSWLDRAEQQGISINELSKLSGVDRSCLERWKHEIPKSLKAYFAIEAQLKATA